LQNILQINPDDCTGCYQCVLACSNEHGEAFSPMKSRIQVFRFEDEGRYVPYTCTQCDATWCMQVCPTGALTRNMATGAVELAAAKCVGCKMCTMACPYGTISYNPQSGKVDKCDLCGGDPACARICPTGAIQYASANAQGDVQ